MFLDDTACNLASLNLLPFRDPETRAFDVASYEHAVRLWTLTLEISVTMAQFPSKEIARLSYDYRTLGLGYANIGGLLMSCGIAYDSDEGRAICGALDRDHDRARLRDLGRDRRQARRLPRPRRQRRARCCASSATTSAPPMARPPATRRCRSRRRRSTMLRSPRPASPGPACRRGARRLGATRWRSATKHGFRNAQVSVIAPTGTIGLVMDCDTTGIEPDFALVKFKKLAGGGYFKIINRAVPEALRALGYSEARDRRDRRLRRRPRFARPVAGRQRRDACAPRASPTRLSTKVEARARRRLRHPLRLQQVDAGRRLPHRRRSRFRPRTLEEPGFDLLAASRLHQERDRRGQRPCLRRDDAGRRAAPQGRAPCRCSIAPIRAGARASAISRSTATSA